MSNPRRCATLDAGSRAGVLFVWALFASILLPGATAKPAVAQGAEATEAAIRLERELLERDKVLFAQARSDESSSVEALASAESDLESALEEGGTSLDEVERLEAALAAAAGELASSRRRTADAADRILERLRRLAVLRTGLRETRVVLEGGDAVTGTWQVAIDSPRQSGIFRLRLQGARVDGIYALDASPLQAGLRSPARSGFLQGTYTGRRLRLDRVDPERGLEGVYEGEVSTADGSVRGFWSPSILSDGGPGGTGWSAVRLSTDPNEPVGEGAAPELAPLEVVGEEPAAEAPAGDDAADSTGGTQDDGSGPPG